MRIKKHSGRVMGHFEPEVSRTFLPGCVLCGGSHPLARKGFKGDPDICPDCGAPVALPGETLTQRGTLGGGFMPFVAHVFLSLGEALAKLAKRI